MSVMGSTATATPVWVSDGTGGLGARVLRLRFPSSSGFPRAGFPRDGLLWDAREVCEVSLRLQPSGDHWHISSAVTRVQ